jgi:F-type H+-transporting ATPase subunit epsilon
MNLIILLPFRIFARRANVSRIVVGTTAGSYGLLPHRLDCVAALVPGIISYWSADNDPAYLAVDRGTLIKSGNEVSIAVRRAIAGTDLADLQQAVMREYRTLDAQEREMRSVMSKMESGFIGRLPGLKS